MFSELNFIRKKTILPIIDSTLPCESTKVGTRVFESTKAGTLPCESTKSSSTIKKSVKTSTRIFESTKVGTLPCESTKVDIPNFQFGSAKSSIGSDVEPTTRLRSEPPISAKKFKKPFYPRLPNVRFSKPYDNKGRNGTPQIEHTNDEKTFVKKNYPITSWGLILFTWSQRSNIFGQENNLGESSERCTLVRESSERCTSKINREPLYLIYQRRDSFEYVEVLRGVWPIPSRDQPFENSVLAHLFSLMTQEEKTRIFTHTFDELWIDLWIDQDKYIFTEGYDKAKKRWGLLVSFFDLLKKIPQCNLIESNLQNVECNLQNVEPPWGFPKGKKNNSLETPQDCALREFHEETRLPTNNIKIIDIKPFVEIHKGSNGKWYKTLYHLGESSEASMVEKISTPDRIRKTAISEEANDIAWCTFEEACLKLNYRKQRLLKQIHWYVMTKYKQM